MSDGVDTRITVDIEFKRPDEKLTEEEICWKNMEQCDKTHQLTFFSACTQAWFRLNPTMSYKDLETELRKREFETHIIAVPNNGPVKYQLGRKYDPNAKNIDYAYYPLISCRPRDLALQELMKYHLSYENNYRKLDKVGDIRNGDADMLTNKDTKLEKYTSPEQLLYELLVECKYVIHAKFSYVRNTQ